MSLELQLPTPDDHRSAALATLWLALDIAADDAINAIILAWLDARGEVPGGFLWLAGSLGMRPSAIEGLFRGMIEGSKNERLKIRRRIRRNMRLLSV